MSMYTGTINTAITTGAWTPINIPANTNVKSFFGKCRNHTPFYISTTASGAGYISFASSFADEIKRPCSGTAIFYVKASVDTTFEMLLKDW